MHNIRNINLNEFLKGHGFTDGKKETALRAYLGCRATVTPSGGRIGEARLKVIRKR